MKDDLTYMTAGEETPILASIPDPPKFHPPKVQKPVVVKPSTSGAKAKAFHPPPPPELEPTPAEKVQAQTKGYYIEPARLLQGLPIATQPLTGLDLYHPKLLDFKLFNFGMVGKNVKRW